MTDSFSINKFYKYFWGLFSGEQRVLNKDTTVWLDGDIPANTQVSPSFPGDTAMHLHCEPTPKKYICK